MILFFAVGPLPGQERHILRNIAVQALKNNEVKKIILTRQPAVEAGESLEFLPGI